MSDITTLRAEIRKLALHLQESAHRHGEVDAYCFWSPQMYRDACVQSNAALTALLNRIDAALSGACGSDSAPDEPQAVAWMDPQSRDVISAERKAFWANRLGEGGANQAVSYSVPLIEFRPTLDIAGAEKGEQR